MKSIHQAVVIKPFLLFCVGLFLSVSLIARPTLVAAQGSAQSSTEEIAQRERAKARQYIWSELYETDQFKVYRDESGPTPVYKAEGYINANIFDVLAVLADVSRRTEWVDSLDEARIIEGEIDRDVTIYERYSLPWPCDDRDTVVRSVIEKDLTKLEVNVRYHRVKHPKVPVDEDIIRMPVVYGNMRFVHAGCGRSFARMILALDVGGAFPQWAVNLFVKRAPVKTLEGMFEQIKRTQGQYSDFINRYKEQAKSLTRLPLDCAPSR